MKNSREKIKSMSGITLVALVVTIVVLIILAVISINLTFGNEGILNNARKAAQDYSNAQVKEEKQLAEYNNEIDNLISGSRNDSANNGITYKSLINKNDGVYNTTDKGYIFNTSTNGSTYSSNNIITIDSIEKYDYIIFEFDIYRKLDGGGYTFHNTKLCSVDVIKNIYTTTMDSNKLIILHNRQNANYTQITISFKNSTTICIYTGMSNVDNYSKFRITDIKGIKF